MEDNKAYVYRHRKAGTSEVFYIGIGQNSNYKRAHDKFNRSKHWKNINKKYGTDVEIISKNLSWEDACELEILLISEYGRLDLGNGVLCNLTDGGEGTLGNLHTEEHRNKMSENMKADKNHFYGKIHTKESRKKMSDALKGEKHPNYGKKYSEERIEKMRELSTGKTTTQEVKNKISENSKGKHSSSKKVINTETLEIYASTGIAATSYGCKGSTLREYLRGAKKNKTTLIYLSEYIEKNPNFKHGQ